MVTIQLIQKSNFKSVKAIARHLQINDSHVFNFIAKRYSKIGKAKRKLIRDFFRQQGWLPTPPPKEKCICEKCGKMHVKKSVRTQHRAEHGAQY